MERLTEFNSETGLSFYPYCFKKCKGNPPAECADCSFNERICNSLAAYEETGLTPDQIMELKSNPPLNAINLINPCFAEAEEQLNTELEEAVKILKKSPMFEGRVTMAIVISSRGNYVRPILYKTKYTPSQHSSDEENLPGQLTFNE